jgi:hypothetical protein
VRCRRCAAGLPRETMVCAVLEQNLQRTRGPDGVSLVQSAGSDVYSVRSLTCTAGAAEPANSRRLP